jgi:hypothetical protein
MGVYVCINLNKATQSIDTFTTVGFKRKGPIGVWEFAQFGFQFFGICSQGNQGGKVHVAANAGGAIVKKGTHNKCFNKKKLEGKLTDAKRKA